MHIIALPVHMQLLHSRVTCMSYRARADYRQMLQEADMQLVNDWVTCIPECAGAHHRDVMQAAHRQLVVQAQEIRMRSQYGQRDPEEIKLQIDKPDIALCRRVGTSRPFEQCTECKTM